MTREGGGNKLLDVLSKVAQTCFKLTEDQYTDRKKRSRGMTYITSKDLPETTTLSELLNDFGDVLTLRDIDEDLSIVTILSFGDTAQKRVTEDHILEDNEDRLVDHPTCERMKLVENEITVS